MAVPEGHGNGSDLDPVAQAPLPGRLIYEGDPQAVYAGESLAQTLRQLQEYGRDGLPVLSGDGRQVQGWITNQSVLQTVAHLIASSAPQQDAANDTTPGLKQPDAGPPTPLHGHRVLEVSIGPESPAVGRPLRSLSWPAGSVPVAILRQRSLREPELTPWLTVTVSACSRRCRAGQLRLRWASRGTEIAAIGQPRRSEVPAGLQATRHALIARSTHVSARLLSAPCLILLPNIGSATWATREAVTQLACQGVVDVLAGRTPANLVTAR
jgi:hypothetical protein